MAGGGWLQMDKRITVAFNETKVKMRATVEEKIATEKRRLAAALAAPVSTTATAATTEAATEAVAAAAAMKAVNQEQE